MFSGVRTTVPGLWARAALQEGLASLVAEPDWEADIQEEALQVVERVLAHGRL
jgi:hypothetical protein